MKVNTAKIFLENLLNRVQISEDGSKVIAGVITDAELEALRIALSLLSPKATEHKDESNIQLGKLPPTVLGIESGRNLCFDVLNLPDPPDNVRICIDFGTAMSKATLVCDDDDADSEELHVLRLGVPGDQEQISDVMLISSVFIDNDGVLWFGKSAVDHSMFEGKDGTRQRLDNIKRSLSEEGHDDFVNDRYNPTSVEVTYGDMVLAYLMFLTWTVNRCVEDLGYPTNVKRRFALPCLSGEKRRETTSRMKAIVGEAQILADTFADEITSGIQIEDFMASVRALRKQSLSFPYVARDITEPLGVAGSIISWKEQVDSLILIVDVGAGTSDFSLYRLHTNPTTENYEAREIEGSSRTLTEAGNHLDRILIELIIKKGGITSDNPRWENIRGALELEIRNHKETLFNDESVFITLMNSTEVEIELHEFLEHESVKSFGSNLKEVMIDILKSIDDSWVGWVTANPKRRLAVALTGGGSDLPMVKDLSEGSVDINGKDILVARSRAFPRWLQELDENLEESYPRIAVSLGGARKQLIYDMGTIGVTAGDVSRPPVLDGYYTKGN